MANPEHVKIVKQGAAAIKAWREKNPTIRLELVDADLCVADLSLADLSGADLCWASLTGAKLDEVCIEDAGMDCTSLTNVDLSKVEGLESVGHFGPSSIGVDTLYKSQGKIPEEFLRGCGVPEDFITYLPAVARRDDAAGSIPVVLHQLQQQRR
jgi:hypothetical protein